mgnify:CR=1 FL=1
MKDEKKPKKGVVVRADLNLEKWPIFTTRKDASDGRVLKREYTDARGAKVTEKVSIGKATLPDGEVCGPFRATDFKVMCVLLHLWDADGRPTDRAVGFSLYQLAKILGISPAGDNIAALRASIMRLKNTPIQWANSYRVGGKGGRTLKSVSQFNILSDIGFLTKTENGETTEVASTFRFNSLILQNIVDLYSKPVLLSTIATLKRDVSVILYRHLDLMLAKKDRYERILDKLIDELGLDNDAYPFPSHKKSLIEPAARELTGLPVSTGFIERAEIVPTESGKDLKLVVIKAATLITPAGSQYSETKGPKKKAAGYSSSAQLDRISADHVVQQYIGALENEEETKEHMASWKLKIWEINEEKRLGTKPPEEEIEQKRAEILLALPATEVEWQRHYFGRLLSAEETEAINRIRQKQLSLFDEKK